MDEYILHKYTAYLEKKITFSQGKYFSSNLKFRKLQFSNIYQTIMRKHSGFIMQVDNPE